MGLGCGRVSKRERWDCEALARNKIRWTRVRPFGARRELSEGATELGGEPTLPAAVFLSSSSETRAARNGLPLDHAPRRLAGVTPPSPFRLSIGGTSPTLNIGNQLPGSKRIGDSLRQRVFAGAIWVPPHETRGAVIPTGGWAAAGVDAPLPGCERRSHWAPEEFRELVSPGSSQGRKRSRPRASARAAERRRRESQPTSVPHRAEVSRVH